MRCPAGDLFECKGDQVLQNTTTPPRCWNLVKDSVKWTDAEAECRLLNATLAEIYSDEDAVLAAQIMQNQSVDYAWIAAKETSYKNWAWGNEDGQCGAVLVSWSWYAWTFL